MIKLVIFDADGVLTDGNFYVDGKGNEFKRFSFKDLDSFNEIKKLGIYTMIITSEKNILSQYIFERFKPDYFADGVNCKYEYIKDFLEKNDYSMQDICYIGDGKKDLECIINFKYTLSPRNSIDEILNASYKVIDCDGGSGVVYGVYKFLKSISNGCSFRDFSFILESHMKICDLLYNNTSFKDSLNDSLNVLLNTLKSGKKILCCGNGGSAADSQHFVAELISKFKYDRISIPAISLTCNTSVLTSIGNDYNFDNIFERQIESLGSYGDSLIAITTSDSSTNIDRAIDQAIKNGMKVILLTSIKSQRSSDSNITVIKIPSDETSKIQEFHIMVIHYICEMLELKTMEDSNEK